MVTRRRTQEIYWLDLIVQRSSEKKKEGLVWVARMIGRQIKDEEKERGG